MDLEVTRKKSFDLGRYSSIYDADSITNRRFYNVGAGTFSHPYWTNVDYQSDWYESNSTTAGSINYDLLALEPIPVEDSSAELFYTSHTVEHITNDAAQNLFDECHRALKSDGLLRITTPNVDLEYRAYKENDRDYFYWIDNYRSKSQWRRGSFSGPLTDATTAQVFLSHFATSMSSLHRDGAADRISDAELASIFEELGKEGGLDHCISRCPLEIQRKFPGNHINWWNFEKLARMLKAAGFEDVYESGFGQSFAPPMRDTSQFDNTHPKISIYVEARKI